MAARSRFDSSPAARWAVSAYVFLALAGTVYATCPALSDPAGGGISYSNVS